MTLGRERLLLLGVATWLFSLWANRDGFLDHVTAVRLTHA